MKFAAVGFTCIDIYKNLGIQYPTGNGIDLLFNLMEQVEEIEPSVVTAVGDDENGRQLLEECRIRQVDTSHVQVVPGGKTAVIENAVKWKGQGSPFCRQRRHAGLQGHKGRYGFHMQPGLYPHGFVLECG